MKPDPKLSGLFGPAVDAIPLEGVRIEARIDGRCSRVRVAQRYHNLETRPVEAVYVFPLEEGAAVCGFTVRIGDRLVVGRVEEREKAFKIYDDAMADGHGAYLLDQERPNVFTASVGNLPAGAQVEVTIEYVALLHFEGESVRFALPTTVSPRYVPAGPPEVGQPDGDRVNPETRTSVPYGLSLELEVDAGAPLKVVESPSHAVRVELDDQRARVTLAHDEVALDRDFVLLVQTRTPHAPSVQAAAEADGTRVVMVTFFPDPGTAVSTGKEIVFLLDCSGSMQGDSIDQARRALELCFRTLAEGDTFNIVRFGSSFQSLWTEPRPYRQESLNEAGAWVRRIDADMGGTEILPALQHILQHPPAGGRHREVLLLTDGEVSNEADVITLCRERRRHGRVFTFGIGAGASEHLVRGVARASRAAAEFIYPGERIEAKVLRMFKRVHSPVFDDIAVDWGGLQVEQAPGACDTLFAGDALTVFGRVRGGASNHVTLRAGGQSWTLALDAERAPSGGPIPTLWAQQRIRDLEEGSGRRGSAQSRRREDRGQTELVELGVRYGLLSSATSYVAVEQRSASEQTTEQAQLRRIPVALTAGWGGKGTVLQGRAGGGAAVMRHASFAAPGAPPPPAPAMAPMGSGGAAPKAKKMAARPAPSVSSPSRERFAPPEAAAFSAFDRFDALCEEEGAGAMMDEAADFDDEAADALYDLLLTQRADGSFPFSAALRRALGDRLAAVEAAARGVDEAVVATAVLMALLVTRWPDRREEWAAAHQKAEKWLARQGVSVDGAALVGG